ncbi:MAG: hypothetical protein AAGU11_20965 [Syntrophobacteraceae bacterium]
MPKENAAQPAGGSYAVIDGHVDILYLMTHSHPETPFEDLEDSPVTLEKMKAGNVRVIVAALYCPDTYNARGSSAYLQYLVDHADKYLAGFVPILSVPELENCLKQEPPGKILLVENSTGSSRMGSRLPVSLTWDATGSAMEMPSLFRKD